MAESKIKMGQVKYLSTSITCPIATSDNGVYIHETNYPNVIPSGSKIINASLRRATTFISWNEDTRKMYLWSEVERPVSATYTIDIWYI